MSLLAASADAFCSAAGGGGYGQNIAAGAGPSSIGAVISNLFYNGEVNLYWEGVAQNNGQPDYNTFESWGHFSQMVWKASTSVACATQHCPNGLSGVGSDVAPYFTVCNYYPPGELEKPDSWPSITLLTEIQAIWLASTLPTSEIHSTRQPSLALDKLGCWKLFTRLSIVCLVHKGLMAWATPIHRLARAWDCKSFGVFLIFC